MDTSDEVTNTVVEDCFSKIKLLGGWNQTEGKFTKNQSYLWDIAKIAGQCKNFEIMYEVLSGIAGQVSWLRGLKFGCPVLDNYSRLKRRQAIAGCRL